MNSLSSDDMPGNLVPAATLGLKTILFKNAAQCEERLIDLGCI
ncbi:MAG: hypothetical protein AB1585_03710 [Thermodesulfobacteriota bacterium]